MKLKMLIIFHVIAWIIYPSDSYAGFIKNRPLLKQFCNDPNVVIIASTGRSGSTMLTEQIAKYSRKSQVMKTHLLPPNKSFKGKIIFIFSNPDKATESALYKLYSDYNFKFHFEHMETADRLWWKKINGKQTMEDNLLLYDAFGIYEHLKAWLYTYTTPSNPYNAQILAIKYEKLWDEKTIDAIKQFLNIPKFSLPPQLTRGTKKNATYPDEIAFRKAYNLGTAKNPRYAAYDDARILWEEAPAFQFLRITHKEP